MINFEVVVGRNYDSGWEIVGKQTYHGDLGTTVTTPETCGEVEAATPDEAIALAIALAKAKGFDVIEDAPHEAGDGVAWDDMVLTADKQFPEHYVIVHVNDPQS